MAAGKNIGLTDRLPQVLCYLEAKKPRRDAGDSATLDPKSCVAASYTTSAAHGPNAAGAQASLDAIQAKGLPAGNSLSFAE